jgi:hypothetical protein
LSANIDRYAAGSKPAAPETVFEIEVIIMPSEYGKFKQFYERVPSREPKFPDLAHKRDECDVEEDC